MCIVGGHHSGSNQLILKFNPNTETWTNVANTTSWFGWSAVTTIKIDDIKEYCNDVNDNDAVDLVVEEDTSISEDGSLINEF